MLDINYIRKNAERVKEFSEQKGYKVDVDSTLKTDAERREILGELETLQAERNKLAEETKRTKGRPSEANIARGKELKVRIGELEDELKNIEQRLSSLLKAIPNVPWSDVPVGSSEDENTVAEIVGEATKTGKNHYEIGTEKGWIDKERAAKVAGARFAYLKGDLVKLEMTIIQFVIDTLTSESKMTEIIASAGLTGKVNERPFVPVLPPLMIKTDMYDAMDRLEPREDRYSGRAMAAGFSRTRLRVHVRWRNP